MNKDKGKEYYLSMMNILYGLQDDLDANKAPQEAKELLSEVIEICKSDFNIKFSAIDTE